MADPILSRAAIISDATTAAERFRETGCDQPCPHLTGSAADLLWREVYARETMAAKVEGGEA